MKTQTYKQWLNEVDKLILNYIGLTTNDIEDYCYRDCFDCGTTPKEMFDTLIEENILPNF